MTVIVEPGDFVIDRLDDNRLREVASVWENTVNMVDGGAMGLDEITHEDIRLPSEVIT